MSGFLGMSDEDFLNAAEPEDTPVQEESSQEDFSEPEETELDEEESHDDTDEDEDESEPESDEDVEDTDPDLPDEDGDGFEPDEDDDEDEPEESDEDSGSKDESDTTGSEAGDLQRVLAPFRANGKDIQVKNVDEAITLMQMGANFTKKMQALQPNLKVVKTLEKNGLLDEEQINFLIDLSKKDPKAIAKLVQSAELDPLELEQDVEYTPTKHQVSDDVIKFTEVLDEIESTPTGARCIDVVANQWDNSSRDDLTKKYPQFMRELNEHMRTGIFDQIQAEVDRVKMFGGLSGLSDFAAYRQVGQQMMQSKALSTPTQAASTEPVATTKVKPKDVLRSKRRKAATSPKAARKTAKAPEVNPLEMSDEDFIKINKLNI